MNCVRLDIEVGRLHVRYSVFLIWDEEGQVWLAQVPAMDGAVTSGETVEEAVAMAHDLIEGRIQVHRDYGEPIPVENVPAQLHSVEVAVPETPLNPPTVEAPFTGTKQQ